MERQMVSTLYDVRQDHLNRYLFAQQFIIRNTGLNGNLIDVGCGVGYGSYILSYDVNHIDAYDISEEAYKIYQDHFRRDNIDFHLEDITKVVFIKKYDVAVCFEFLEHIPEDTAIEVIKRIGEISPILISSVPNEEVRPWAQEPVNKFHFKHYTPKEYEELLAKGGYKIFHKGNQKSGANPAIREGFDGKFMISIATK